MSPTIATELWLTDRPLQDSLACMVCVLFTRHAPVQRATVAPSPYNSSLYYSRKSESLPRGLIPRYACQPTSAMYLLSFNLSFRCFFEFSGEFSCVPCPITVHFCLPIYIRFCLLFAWCAWISKCVHPWMFGIAINCQAWPLCFSFSTTVIVVLNELFTSVNDLDSAFRIAMSIVCLESYSFSRFEVFRRWFSFFHCCLLQAHSIVHLTICRTLFCVSRNGRGWVTSFLCSWHA